jgi:hypothetical protein
LTDPESWSLTAAASPKISDESKLFWQIATKKATPSYFFATAHFLPTCISLKILNLSIQHLAKDLMNLS